MRFSYLIPFKSLPNIWNDPDYLQQWTNWNSSAYVMLQEGVSAEEVSLKIVDRVNRDSNSNKLDLFLRSYSDLYLYGLTIGRGRIGLVIFFSLIAMFILVIACINFMNLSTARATNRAKEIGLRKVAGATKRNIIYQFYTESFLLVLIAFIVAVMLLELILPEFGRFVGKQLSFDIINNRVLALGIPAVIILTGLLAGSYPALVMSSFKPGRILKGILSFGSGTANFRRVLVVFQFVLSIVLIVFTFIILEQVDYMRNADIGFEKEQLVYVKLDGALKDKYEAAKTEFLQSPGIQTVSLTSHIPGSVYTNGSQWDWTGKDPNINPLVTYFCTDLDFMETFGCNMNQGDYYSKERDARASYLTGDIIINEQFAAIIGGDDMIGKHLSRGADNYQVIGVMKNFNFKPLYQEIEPMIIYKQSFSSRSPSRYKYLFARISPDNVSRTVAGMEEVYKKFNPDYSFNLRFYDETYERMYRSQEYFGMIIKFFAGLTILISSLGLMGLAAYSAEQRTREIGVRKVLGASVGTIVGLMSRDFLKLVIIANLIALPVSYLLAYGWLSNFAYRMDLGWEILTLTFFMTVGIAFLAVSYHAVKAAWVNPVDSLRHD